MACAPAPDIAEAVWQRLLAGQVLPLVALLRGREVLHAGSVDVQGEAWLFSGPSGAGKTTAVMAEIERGAALLADDVAALSVEGGRVVVHPGPGMVNVKDEGAANGERRTSVAVRDRPMPVARVVLLAPVPAAPRITLAPIDGPVAPALLATTFNGYVDSPDRLATQLGLLSALARQAQVLKAEVPRSLGPRALGDALRRPII